MNDRIRVFSNALRCFSCGLVGLVPLLGMPAAVAALVSYFRAPPANAHDLSLVRRYLRWGLVLGCIGLGVTALGVLAVTALILRQITSGEADLL